MTVPRDSKVESWQDDLGRIAGEVVGLFFARNVHSALNEIITDNDDLPPSVFYGYLHTTYANTQTIAIRRQLDTRDDDHVSLARPADEVIKRHILPETSKHTSGLAGWYSPKRRRGR